jgi:hypothetical protein
MLSSEDFRTSLQALTSAYRHTSEVFGPAAILSGYRVTFAVPLRQAT